MADQEKTREKDEEKILAFPEKDGVDSPQKEKGDGLSSKEEEKEEKKPGPLGRLIGKLPNPQFKLPKPPIHRIKAPIVAFFKFFKNFAITFAQGDLRTKMIGFAFVFCVTVAIGSGLKVIQSAVDLFHEYYGSEKVKAQLDQIRTELRNEEFDFQTFMEKRFGSADDHRRMEIGPLTLVANSDRNPTLKAIELTIHIVCDTPESAEFFKKNRAQAQDAIITTIEPVNFDKTRQPAGKKDLRQEIKDALNKLGRSNAVEQVFFSEYLGT